MSDPGKAVFLSYASQDAEAARRICDALRSAGVEVWFDQSELRGGDAWDAMIRKRIKECALFVSVISANTNARAEGYFRLEWRLADQRTHLMGRSKAFLLPVCIDDTPAAGADVPDSFMAVQWTRLPKGEPPAGFGEQVKRLLSGEQGSREQRAPSFALRSVVLEGRESPATGAGPRGGGSEAGGDGTDADRALVVPDYELIRKIGSGAYGDVWLAQGVTGIHRAVKVVWRERFEDAEPFEREFRGLREFAAISLKVEGQLALLHIGRNDAAGFFYYVMELADDANTGRTFDPATYVPLTLKELKRRKGRVSAANAVAIGVELATALAALHARGLVHRDIKPSNAILVNGKAKLADIGLVSAAHEARTFIGTTGYVPPEGPGTPSADVFALGRVLYELATGFDGDRFPELPAGFGAPAERALFFALNEVLLQAAAPDPRERYAEARALSDDLIRVGRGARSARLLPVLWATAFALLALGGVGAAAWWWNARPAPAAPSPEPVAAAVEARKSLAVLPFANLSAETENEFFAEGMHDDLITALAKVRDLKVISRTSTLAYRDTSARNLRKIAAELGVATVLEGSVQRAGNRVRINLQLIDARTDAHLWAETYNRELTDIFALQAELVLQVSGALKATLTAGEKDLLARRPTTNAAAYDIYLRARVLDQNLRIYSSLEEYRRVVELYAQAAVLDPSFTLAHVQASISHGTLFWFTSLDPTPERRELARSAMEKARALAPGSPEVRLAEGSFEYTCNYNWRGALEHYRAAEAGLPNDAQLSHRIALAHRRLGEHAEALRRVERACELNPHDLRSASMLIETLMVLRRYAEVVTAYDRYLHSLAGDHRITRFRLLAQQELDGDWPAYLRAMAMVPPRSDDPEGLNRDYVMALESGDWDRAEHIVHDPRFRFFLGLSGVVNEPAALHQAQLAWCRGRPEAAAEHAAEAAAYFRGRTWNARQQPSVQMGLARAEAFAGRSDEALRTARAALVAQEALESRTLEFLRHHQAQVLVVAGRREEALEALRTMVRGPATITSGELRRDPVLMRLKDDPRFEEILKSAKPL